LPPKIRGRLLTLVNGYKATPHQHGLQPHLMWLKPVTFIKSANRQLPACRKGRKQMAIWNKRKKATS
jgi:hypothetical protein